jgi:hypothetical protein
MSKQDIEKRLGFAAQGVKSEFGSNDPYMQERTVKTRKGKTTDLVAEIGQNGGGGDYIATLMLVHSNGEPQVLQSKYGYKTPESATRAAIRLFDAHVSRGSYARPNAKKASTDFDLEEACWEGYEAVGTKKKDGKTVPNCVPKKKASRPGVKAKMALTISTVGAKNLCYEALANLGELAKLASETNSGWDFHVNVMTNHVKDAIARMETKPTQAATDLDKAIDTLGMLRKIEPKRLNDNQKGSFKQLIGYVAKSLRDAKANIKVVTTASRPGVKAKFATEVGRKGNKSAMISRDATGTYYAYVVQRIETGIGKDEDMLGTMRAYSTEARAKAAALRGLETSGLRGGFARPGVKAEFGRFSTEFGFLANQIKNQPDLAKKNIIVLAKKMGDKSDITIDEFEQLVEYAEKLGMGSQVINAYDSVHPGFSRTGTKAKMAASDIIVKKDAQYIYYYPEDDDRATFADDNGKGAYTVKSNRTGKPVSAKTYRSLQEAVSASNAMNEKLPPLKKAKSSRLGAKAKA